MAYVDEDMVAAKLTSWFAGTQLTAQAEEAEDESVDASVRLTVGGTESPFNVQVGGGYVVLNESLYRGTPPEFYGSKLHRSYGVQPDDLDQLCRDVQRLVAPTA